MRPREAEHRVAATLAALLGLLAAGGAEAQSALDPDEGDEAGRRLEARIEPHSDGASLVFYYADETPADAGESSDEGEAAASPPDETSHTGPDWATPPDPAAIAPAPLSDSGPSLAPAQRWRARIEQGFSRARRALPPKLLHRADRWLDDAARHAGTPRGRLLALLSGVGFLALIVGQRWLRGHGDVVVCMEYPAELRGTFSVRLNLRKGQRRTRSSPEAILKGGASTRTEHHSVNRETQFRRIPPRRYFVSVEGVLRDPDASEVLSTVFEERIVRVKRGSATRVDLDVSPATCPVDVKVTWDERPAREASVSARGLPQSLRYARGGSTRLQLTPGRHTITAGCGDRVAERDVEVASHRPTLVELDLASADILVFKGCPPAVQPYLNGDLNAAARALERDGHADHANLLLARLFEMHGDAGRAASHLESAGRLLEAAELLASLSRFDKAAELFERTGDPGRAAQMLHRAGELERAGDLWMNAETWDEAVACYRECGATPKQIDALEARGDLLDAAKLALEHDERARAIQLLQQVTVRSPCFPEAGQLLVEAYEHEGHRDLAARKLEEIIDASGEKTSPDVHSHLADLLDQSGDTGKALEVLESLRQRDPTYPNVATRIETLRKRVSEQSLGNAQSGRSDTAPTAFVSASRYELLEEIGRGGMGVVFKARDQRLNRIVALKQLPATLREHTKAIELFLREAQAAARLNHPNIVTVYDTDQQDGNFFITMELLEGRPLNAILRKRRRIPAPTVARLGMQIAAGLDYAHRQGIIHRDIKTANLFFTVDKIVKIMDFGLAKMVEEVRRGTTVIGGTPFYMAPEQSVGGPVDLRADIYAFGVTLFELVTGAVPFRDGDVAYQHRHTAMPDPRDRCAEVPNALAELILAMTKKAPDERLGSAAEIGERLAELVGAGPGASKG